MGITITPNRIERFPHEEDDGTYNVWKIDTCESSIVLKEAKGCELDIYQTFFSEKCAYAPKLLGTAWVEEKNYLLMEYVPGENLRHCTREKLTNTLDSLIAMQRAWWQHLAPEHGYHFAQSLSGREKRSHYLKDVQLEKAYSAYLKEYHSVPQTLCHDDLLPFNVLFDGKHAVFIDWEAGGILPYLTSLARLIAHGEESEDAFFYMKEVDKQYAVQYYFDHFIAETGIAYETYLTTMRLFLFYEYCEWVYVGNKYNNTTMPRFQSYFQKAKRLAAELGF